MRLLFIGNIQTSAVPRARKKVQRLIVFKSTICLCADRCGPSSVSDILPAPSSILKSYLGFTSEPNISTWLAAASSNLNGTRPTETSKLGYTGYRKPNDLQLERQREFESENPPIT